MFRATVQLDTDVLDAIAETAIEAPQRMRTAAGLVARGDTAQAMIVELSTEPRPAAKPIDWTSPKQQRYVMWKLKREGFPGRSHKLAQAWRVVLDFLNGLLGGVLSVENNDPAAQFVQGEYQQRMHANTGWPLARLVIRNYQEELQDEIITAWLHVVGVKK